MKWEWEVGDSVEYFNPERVWQRRDRGTGEPAVVMEVIPKKKYVNIQYLKIGLLLPGGGISQEKIVDDNDVKEIEGHEVHVDNTSIFDEHGVPQYEDTRSFLDVNVGCNVIFKEKSHDGKMFKAGVPYKCIKVGMGYFDIIGEDGERVNINWIGDKERIIRS